MTETWHADLGELAGYAAGAIDDTRAGSIEAHLVTCAHCRDQVAAVADRGRLDKAWSGIVDTLDTPRPTVVERVLRRTGVGADTARLLAATPSLQGSWLLAVVLALGFVTLAAQSGTDRGLVMFLTVAPLIPVAGVAAAFGQGLDPTWEITAAAPGGGFRLLLLRASAVFGATFAAAAVSALALPGQSWTAAAWVLPAFALTLASLALSTFTSPERAATAVAVGWIVVVTASATETRDLLTAFAAVGQLSLAVVAVLAAILVARRRDSFEIRSNL
ncbi:MAG: zf-HC2 domain-containing protein [Acidimicrobiales bacterium]